MLKPRTYALNFINFLFFFDQAIEELNPQFIALHCQEVGGKNYEASMKHVQNFVRSVILYFDSL